MEVDITKEYGRYMAYEAPAIEHRELIDDPLVLGLHTS
jgi:hypothetical protein